jgi:hypothetical protein
LTAPGAMLDGSVATIALAVSDSVPSVSVPMAALEICTVSPV